MAAPRASTPGLGAGGNGWGRNVAQDGQTQHTRFGGPAAVLAIARRWRAVAALIGGLVAAGVSSAFDDFSGYIASDHTIHKLVSAGCAVVFLVLGIVATFGLAEKGRRAAHPRMGQAHAAVVRYAGLLVGIVATVIITLELLKIPVGQLVVGGVLTSVLVGIAAQQSLSNLFAGMVLLIARPFRVGDRIQLRTSTLGGQLDGTVTEIGVTYVRFDVGDTVLSIPNATILAAAVGPAPPPAEPVPVPAEPQPAEPQPDAPPANR